MPNATVRANARIMPKTNSRPTPHDFIDDISFLPDRYAMPVVGDCLAPEIDDGALLMFDKNEPYRVGDLVVLFRSRDATPEGKFQAMVKRLIMAPPHWVSFPWRDHPESDVLALIGVEQLNPARRFTMRCCDIIGIHKCLGVAPADSMRAKMQIPESARKEKRL